MALKVKKLYIQNFKVFTEQSVDLGESDLIVFDGPNGFGKTSLYDAIELLFTGKIRRYENLKKTAIDSRENFNENPWLHNDFPEGDIIIKAEISFDNVTKILMRKAKNQDLKQTQFFDSFRLYEFDTFDSESGTLIADEIAYLTQLLGEDYNQNFQFLNYIEQEDSIRLLKSKDREKKNEIAHLFNTFDFEKDYKIIKEVHAKIKVLCKKDIESDLKRRGNEIIELKKKLIKQEDCQYFKLIPGGTNFWDVEHVEFKQNVFSDIVGEEGLLVKFLNLCENKTHFKNYRFNKKVDQIISRENEITSFLRFYSFIDRKEELIQLKRRLDSAKRLLESLNELSIDNIASEQLAISSELEKYIDSTELVRSYNSLRSSLILRKKQTSSLEAVRIGLKQHHSNLISKFDEYCKLRNDTSVCPFCGHDWEESQKLKENIEQQSLELEEIIKGTSQELIKSISDFKEGEVTQLKNKLSELIKSNPIDAEFILQLEKSDELKLLSFKKILDGLEVDVTSYLNNNPTLNSEINVQDLINTLKGTRKQYEESKIAPYFNDVFSQVFKNAEVSLDEISLDDIKEKIKYIEWQYSIFQNSEITKREQTLKVAWDNYNRAKETTNNLKKIIVVYQESLKEYSQKLISDIEILFHIYSARIIQDYQGGLGLFIDNKKGIRFLTDPSKEFDAVFKLSSGQLSALIISFTLALNKKYSRNKVLFIDDPVQTMDELNIAGFIEVLRNDFKDRQIFISTHEDMMSSYMRYKFDKFNLKSKRINVKEIANA
ncbi:hypothetical protein DMA11_23505 [Marinilabiliaceae bacterium JC017]|nr:hypothetical protein DMA11_23505 [Marinilabiliaceae bacterium JC017]